MNLRNRMVSALVFTLVAAPAGAQDVFKFSGFGTLSAVKSSEKNADFAANYVQPKGPGFSRSVDFGPDSKLGAQVDLRFSEKVSAVIQVVADHRYDDSYTPDLSMANLKFQALPQLGFRVGRMPFSAYLISDYKKVGYSTPWVRPPLEVYQFNPLVSFDGADVSFQHAVGSASFQWQVMGGTTLAKLPQADAKAEFKGKGLAAASLSVAAGSATYRAFYLQMKGTLDHPDLDGPAGPFALLRAPIIPNPFGGTPPFIPNPYYSLALADQYQLKDDRITYMSVGFNYDPGGWFVMAEAARNAGDENILLHATGAYLTVGVRVKAWTPYVTLASRTTDSPITHANAVVNAMVSGNDQAQSSVSAGLRWDFHSQADLKLQVDQIKNATGSSGALVNTQPGFKPGESYTLITLALDFVF